MTKQKPLKITAATAITICQHISDMESSINAITWGCDALVNTLFDGKPARVDGAVWVADKIREEATKLQVQYRLLLRLAQQRRG